MLEILDTSLRDGVQSENITLSCNDKLQIICLLKELGVTYIEAGAPYANPIDTELFNVLAARGMTDGIVAFGSTMLKGTDIDRDPVISALINCPCNIISVYGKSDRRHAEEILGVTPEKNLDMIAKSVNRLVRAGKKVFFLAEHFYDGYLFDGDYAMSALKAAREAGADKLVLCDTNGGSTPADFYRVTRDVTAVYGGELLGVHCHNDMGLAVSHSMAAASLNVAHVQGTVLGYGERCGNTNLATFIANMQLKEGVKILKGNKIKLLAEIAGKIADICMTDIPRYAPYVGKSAFCHKAGAHYDAVIKNSERYEHVLPSCVGAERRLLISELSGRGSVLDKFGYLLKDSNKDGKEIKTLMSAVKLKIEEGCNYENAEASLYILICKTLGRYEAAFKLVNYKVLSEQNVSGEYTDTAVLTVRVGEKEVLQCANGKGPVDALDRALRKALSVHYPFLNGVQLTDYKVRVLNSSSTTAAKVRVSICFTDGEREWATVGVSEDIIQASFYALCDAVEYYLELKKGKIQ